MVLAAVPGVAVRGLAGAAAAAVGASGAGSPPVLVLPSYTSAEDCCMLSYEHRSTGHSRVLE